MTPERTAATRPGVYFADHVYGCFFSDQFGLENLDHVGVDNVMFERRARRFDLAPGYPADRFVFDRDEIRRPARREYGRDLAGGIGRFQAYPSGVRPRS